MKGRLCYFFIYKSCESRIANLLSYVSWYLIGLVIGLLKLFHVVDLQWIRVQEQEKVLTNKNSILWLLLKLRQSISLTPRTIDPADKFGEEKYFKKVQKCNHGIFLSWKNKSFKIYVILGCEQGPKKMQAVLLLFAPIGYLVIQNRNEISSPRIIDLPWLAFR